jgi:hypothetical protein
LIDPAHFIMERNDDGCQELAEGGPLRLASRPWRRPGSRPPRSARRLVGTKKRKGPWLVLPAIYAFLILQQTSDLRAALAGFTALALAVVGFLVFQKRWWIYFGFLMIYCTAVLFLAADAWIVFGLVFLAAFAVLTAAGLKGLRAR